MRLCFYTLLAYDYKLAFASIKSYYDIADEIILAVDSARISFTGKPFKFDEDDVNAFIKRIDTKKKIKLVQQPFFDASLSSLDNEVSERNKISLMFPEDAYVIAIDSDEVLINPDEFWMWFSGQEIKDDLEAISYTIYKRFEDRLLVSEPFEKVIIGTYNKGQYRLHRATHSDVRIKCPLKIMHCSWGRAREDVLVKLENCSYGNSINKDEFIKAWDAVSVDNHSNAKIIHPLGIKGVFKSLRLLTLERFGIKAEVNKEAIRAAKSDKYSIVCPIKNQFKIVQKCLDSFERNCKGHEIVLIDDGSTEEQTIKLIKDMAKKNNWKYFRNEKSTGHTKASELGITHSYHENVFLVNSDVIVPKGGLKLLADVLNKYDDIGVVGPSTSSASGPQQIQDAYVNRFLWSNDQIDAFAESLKDDTGILDLPLICGFAMGIKKSLFVKIAGFDKALNCYGNEKELLIRVRKAGFRTVWVKRVYVHHFGRISYTNSGINIGQAQIDGDRYIIKKHGRLA